MSTKIPYCDKTWDLTIGCRKRSPGCEHCWAVPTVHRLAGKGVTGYCSSLDSERTKQVFSIQTRYDGKDWLQTQRVNLLEQNLEMPRTWRKPAFIFANSKSDLFDDRVPFDFIARAFDVMAETRHHRYMVLTKQIERAGEFIDFYMSCGRTLRWPDAFGHVILMVSVEGDSFVWRIERLLGIPAMMRGVSIEPFLSPIDMLPWLADSKCQNCGWPFGADPRLDWVVVGCEKRLGGTAGRWAGQNAIAWWAQAKKIIDGCRWAGVDVWMKQGPKETFRGKRRMGGREKVTSDPGDFPPSCRVQQKPKGLILHA